MNAYVQYLRGIAAIFVVLHHTSLRIEQTYGAAPLDAIGNGHALAYLGVNLFYCLSGYLMASLATTTPILTFAWHRLARIYPAFFMAIGITFALCLIFAGGLPEMNWWSLTLLPLQLYGPLQVEWTLNYELAFYALTAVFCLPAARRFHLHFLVVWLCCILIAYYGFDGFGTSQFPAFYELPFSMWSLSFVLGGLTFHALKNQSFRNTSMKVGPYALVLTMAFALFGSSPSGYQAIMVATLLAMVLAFAFTTTAAWRSRTLNVLGNASYGIYLIHQVVSAFAMSLLAHKISSPFTMWVIILALSLASGLVLGVADVETYKRLRRLGARIPSRLAPQAMGIK